MDCDEATIHSDRLRSFANVCGLLRMKRLLAILQFGASFHDIWISIETNLSILLIIPPSVICSVGQGLMGDSLAP